MANLPMAMPVGVIPFTVREIGCAHGRLLSTAAVQDVKALLALHGDRDAQFVCVLNENGSMAPAGNYYLRHGQTLLFQTSNRVKIKKLEDALRQAYARARQEAAVSIAEEEGFCVAADYIGCMGVTAVIDVSMIGFGRTNEGSFERFVHRAGNNRRIRQILNLHIMFPNTRPTEPEVLIEIGNTAYTASIEDLRHPLNIDNLDRLVNCAVTCLRAAVQRNVHVTQGMRQNLWFLEMYVPSWRKAFVEKRRGS